jgi:hypothetical protein
MKRHTLLVALAALAGACGEPATQPSAPSTLHAPGAPASILGPTDGTRVMQNLLSPRGLAFSPDGALYVVEAGLGGTVAKGPCFFPFPANFPSCYGNTGGVSRLRDGVQERVIDDLPSYAQVQSGQGEGPSGISFHGNGHAYVTIGLHSNPIPLRTPATPEWYNMARLVHLEPSALSHGNGAGHAKKSSWEFVADLAQYEIDMNPDCGDTDTNPFGVLADDGGVMIMDAGANAIVRLGANGELSTVLAFSNNTTVPGPGCPPAGTRDFVPTAITTGPDGAYYFGHLNGLQVLPGSSKVYRLERGGTPVVFAENFTWIVALAFDSRGNLYVLQFTETTQQTSGGVLLRVAPDGTREKLVGGLERAAGMTVGPDDAVYISMIPGKNYRAPGEVRRYVFP